jgi:diaminopimelate decarboxylase/aspartate kinase
LADKWIVLKFGGTSVAARPQWETIARLVSDRNAEGYRVLLVCSAVAGVTDLLNALADEPASLSSQEQFWQVHRSLGRELGVDEGSWLPEAQNLLRQALEAIAENPLPSSRAALLATGEWLSTRIGAEFLQQQVAAAWVDAREALEVITEDDLSPARQWLSAGCSAGRDSALAQRWASLAPVLITQGFVGRTRDGRTALLGRGGSDTSAALLAGRLGAELIEIWTDVPGLFSADPRTIRRARLLHAVNYDEALEMAASGAGVIHPRAIRAAAVTATPVVIRDLARKDVSGTRIGLGGEVRPGIKAITCQQNMAVMLLENLDARYQVGFLAGVFDVFRRHGVSVDLVATSETTTTVAINCAANHLEGAGLNRLEDDLQNLCKVKSFPRAVCVNLVGHGARTALSRLGGVLQCFDDRPLLMVSQSANDLCLSLLVEEGDHGPLLHGAHELLIPPDDAGPDPIFGSSWEQINRRGG